MGSTDTTFSSHHKIEDSAEQVMGGILMALKCLKLIDCVTMHSLNNPG